VIILTGIADLQPCRYISDDPSFLAVGWLDIDMPYAQGESSPEVFARLLELCAHPWRPFVACGFHECSLCQFDPARFSGELFVPGDKCIFVAPVGIVHYVARHWYEPPAVFAEAVLLCPPTRSMAYKRALLANGVRKLLKNGDRAELGDS
jgi:hypothetical protein